MPECIFYMGKVAYFGGGVRVLPEEVLGVSFYGEESRVFGL